MSNNNKIKNENSIEENNPQISIIMLNASDNNNLINKDENKGIFYTEKKKNSKTNFLKILTYIKPKDFIKKENIQIILMNINLVD